MKKLLYIVLLLPLLVFNCSSENEPSSKDSGQGGSLSRFVILNDYMYVVDHKNLNVFNIANPKNPIAVSTARIGFEIETLSSYGNYLYIGSQRGFFIYEVTTNPEFPEKLSEVQHFRACDPVVANETHAYVTLHSDIGCGTTINALEIYDISNITQPVLLKRRDLVSPIGLALYNDYLFVCDDEVKVFDISNPKEPKIVHSVAKSAFDVIIKNNSLILIGKSGLYQYSLDKTDITKTNHISTIKI